MAYNYGNGGGGGPPAVPSHIQQSFSHASPPPQQQQPQADAGDWREAQDPNSGKTYYYNTKTKAVSWSNPMGNEPPAAANGQSRAPAASAAAPAAARPSAAASAPAHNWKTATAPGTGRTYYYNTVTRQTQYEMPDEMLQEQQQQQQAGPLSPQVTNGHGAPSARPSVAPAASAAPSHNWKTATAPDSGRTYYYNTVTRQTQYEVPDEVLQEQQQQQQDEQYPDTYSDTESLYSQSMQQHRPSYEHRRDGTMATQSSQGTSAGGGSGDYRTSYADNNTMSSSAGPPPRQPTQSPPQVPLAALNDTVSKASAASRAAMSETKTMDPAQAGPRSYPSHDQGQEVLIIAHEENPQYLSKIAGDRASQFRWEKYCNLYFSRHRKGGIMKFAKCSLEDMMSHTTGVIPGPLKKLLPENHKAAVQFWRNITGFMGDRSSTKEAVPHLRKLIHFALDAPEEVHDEIYCQILKQTTKNPKPASLLKGWQLMAICLGFFKPSDELACYLAVHFLQHSSAGGEIGQFAKYCLERLERIMKFQQPRTFVPAQVEIDAVQLRKPIEVRVEFLDETYRTIAIDSFTTAKEVFKAMIIGLDLSNPRHYTLSAMETPTSPEDEQKRRDAYEALYKSKEWLKQHTPDEAMPYEELRERRIRPEKRLVDVLGEFEANNRRNQENRKYKIALKKRILLEDSNDPEAMNTDLERKLHFCQIAYDVVQGYYDVSEKEATTLAAIQVQADHGVNDLSFYSSGLISDKLHRYIAKKFRVKRDPIYLAGRIIGEHEQYVELTQQEARDLYLDRVRQFSTFGCSWFVALQTTRTTHAVDTGKQQLIGISSKNVVLLDPQTRAIKGTFPIQDVLTEGYKPDTFVLVVGDLVQQKKFNYRTPHGKELHSLLREYTNILNFIDEEEGGDEYEFE